MPTLANDRIRILKIETLSDNWYVLKKTTFEYQRSDGTWQTLSRETYDRGNGAVILPYNHERRTVILTRQFRFPAYVNGHSGMLIEACAGLLDEHPQLDEVIRFMRDHADVTHVDRELQTFSDAFPVGAGFENWRRKP